MTCRREGFLQADGSILDVMEIADGEFLIRSGTTIVGVPATDYQAVSEKDAANGYAGLDASSRTTKGVITADDLIVTDSSKGLVLKDNAGTPHYWRVTMDSAGTLIITDLGTSPP